MDMYWRASSSTHARDGTHTNQHTYPIIPIVLLVSLPVTRPLLVGPLLAALLWARGRWVRLAVEGEGLCVYIYVLCRVVMSSSMRKRGTTAAVPPRMHYTHNRPPYIHTRQPHAPRERAARSRPCRRQPQTPPPPRPSSRSCPPHPAACSSPRASRSCRCRGFNVERGDQSHRKGA